MSTAARLAKLEGTLSPKEATLAWLAEAHQFPTLTAYVGWLVTQPPEAAPFWRVPEQAERAVRAAMRGEPRSAIEAAAHQAVRDAVFLVELVIRLNLDASEVVRTETLRAAALTWEARALAAADRGEIASQYRARKARRCGVWSADVAAWTFDLDGAEATLRHLERDYIDGNDALFPDLACQWARLRAAADDLITAAADTSSSPGSRPVRARRLRGRQPASRSIQANATQLTEVIREATRGLLGRAPGGAGPRSIAR